MSLEAEHARRKTSMKTESSGRLRTILVASSSPLEPRYFNVFLRQWWYVKTAEAAKASAHQTPDFGDGTPVRTPAPVRPDPLQPRLPLDPMPERC